ncbi:MAG: DUF4124 domain-containing protein [Myxococcaceae bacterium]
MPLARWLVLVILFGSGAASAQSIYQWTDADGGMHFTDDPGSIPQKYRARSQTLSGPELGVVQVKTGEDAEDPKAVPATAPAPTPSYSEQREAEQLALERHWRGAFRAAYQKIEQLESSIKAGQKRLDDPAASGLMTFNAYTGQQVQSPELELLRERVRRSEVDLKHAREDLENLDRDASRHSIPREWRR